MTDITYTQGDATDPNPREGFIVHVCNDQGGWGSGFVVAVSNRWSAPEAQYRTWHRQGISSMGRPFRLGEVAYINVEPGLHVANMIAQHAYSRPGEPAIRYEALDQCLQAVASKAQDHNNANVHMPRIGCGLAGSTWDQIEPIVQRTLIESGVPVTVYDL
jgi:O-acetyl-ADP-ribose deacetylase (regulator of RNase III)